MHINAPKCYRSVGEKIDCRICNGKTIKYGTTRQHKQRYKCKNCNHTFLLSYCNNACVTGTNHSITEYIKEGCGIRSISRLLKISCTTVLKEIIRIASAIKKPLIAMGKEYELDEICTYVKRKANMRWIVYAITKDTNEVVDFTVGSRTNKTLQRVTDTLILSNARMVYTDKLPQYNTLLPEKIHCTQQYGTNHIERNNLTLRTHLKRLNRRTICFSKSVKMLMACLTIYFWS